MILFYIKFGFLILCSFNNIKKGLSILSILDIKDLIDSLNVNIIFNLATLE